MYYLNSYKYRIADIYLFNSIRITYSSDIQTLINNAQYNFSRYADINKIITFLEDEKITETITILSRSKRNL